MPCDLTSWLRETLLIRGPPTVNRIADIPSRRESNLSHSDAPDLDDEDIEWGITPHGGAGGGAGGGFRGKLSTLDEESLGKVMQKWMHAPVDGDSPSSLGEKGRCSMRGSWSMGLSFYG